MRERDKRNYSLFCVDFLFAIFFFSKNVVGNMDYLEFKEFHCDESSAFLQQDAEILHLTCQRKNEELRQDTAFSHRTCQLQNEELCEELQRQQDKKRVMHLPAIFQPMNARAFEKPREYHLSFANRPSYTKQCFKKEGCLAQMQGGDCPGCAELTQSYSCLTVNGVVRNVLTPVVYDKQQCGGIQRQDLFVLSKQHMQAQQYHQDRFFLQRLQIRKEHKEQMNVLTQKQKKALEDFFINSNKQLAEYNELFDNKLDQKVLVLQDQYVTIKKTLHDRMQQEVIKIKTIFPMPSHLQVHNMQHHLQVHNIQQQCFAIKQTFTEQVAFVEKQHKDERKEIYIRYQEVYEEEIQQGQTKFDDKYRSIEQLFVADEFLTRFNNFLMLQDLDFLEKQSYDRQVLLGNIHRLPVDEQTKQNERLCYEQAKQNECHELKNWHFLTSFQISLYKALQL